MIPFFFIFHFAFIFNKENDRMSNYKLLSFSLFATICWPITLSILVFGYFFGKNERSFTKTKSKKQIRDEKIKKILKKNIFGN